MNLRPLSLHHAMPVAAQSLVQVQCIMQCQWQPRAWFRCNAMHHAMPVAAQSLVQYFYVHLMGLLGPSNLLRCCLWHCRSTREQFNECYNVQSCWISGSGTEKPLHGFTGVALSYSAIMTPCILLCLWCTSSLLGVIMNVSDMSTEVHRD